MKTQKSGTHVLVGMSPLQQFIYEQRSKISQNNVTTAKENALNPKLSLSDCPLNMHTIHLSTAYGVVFNQAMMLSKPDLNLKYGRVEKSHVDALNIDAQKRIDKLQALNDAVNEDIDQTPSLWILGQFVLLFIVFLAMYAGEILMLAYAFQMLGKSFLTSLLIATTVSVSLILLVSYIPSKINQLTPRLIRILARVIFTLFILGVFYAIGNMRSDYVQIMNGSTVSPWEFAILNFVAFVGQYVLSVYCIHPLFAQVPGAFHAFKTQYAIASRNREINALEATKRNNKSQLSDSLKSKLFILDEADDLPRLLNSLYKEDVAQYQRVFIEHMPELSNIPPCFHTPVTDLIFTPSTHTEYTQL